MNTPENVENGNIVISTTVPQDAEGINTVLYKTWLATYPNEELGITREDIEDTYKDAFTEKVIRERQESIANTPPNQKRMVAKQGDIVVGVLVVVRNENNNLLKTIYVLPELQGKGIGTMLWNEEKSFCDLRKDTIVHVASYNHKTIEFYKKLGFIDTGKRFTDERWKMRSGATIPEMEMVIKGK